MASPQIAPFGTWASPIDALRVAAGVRPLAAPRLARDTVWWLEGRPDEGGRVVAMRARRGEAGQLVTPAPFNVRTRVHEYGGGAYAVDGDTTFFSNFADNRVYRQQVGDAPQPITHDSALRHADFELDAARRRLIAVQEDHRAADHEPVNRLVALAMDGAHEPQELAAGFDFYAAPRLSPDGRRLAWLAWNHPSMPWDGTELWLADVAPDGRLADARRIAGGPGESLCQPLWSPGGVLYVVSDRTGWWNVYRVQERGGESTLEPVCPMSAEFGRPQWVFGQAMVGFTRDDEIVAACIDAGVSRLVRIDLREGGVRPIETSYVDVQELRAGADCAVVLAGAPDTPDQIVRMDLVGGAREVLARSTADVPDGDVVSLPEPLGYASAGGRTAHAFFYPPHNDGYEPPPGELPPLIVTSHGGPTSMSTSTLRLSIQFWTSRGFAVLDVNYGGSTGYGRAYRELLDGQWGVVDVEDCVAGARERPIFSGHGRGSILPPMGNCVLDTVGGSGASEGGR